MQNYTTIIGVIELRIQGHSYSTVQQRYSVGSSTAQLIMKRYDEYGLSLQTLKEMQPHKVEALFYPKEYMQRRPIPLPDFESYYQRMNERGSKLNLSYFWIEYKEKHPDGYQYSQFCELYRNFVKLNHAGAKVSMAVERIPGEKMYIDWVGDKPYLICDPATGEIKQVHIFATTMGVSSMVYAEAFLDEKLPSFITGTVNALNFYGGSPKYLVPDNCKTAVTKHTKDEIIINSAYQDLEEFYDVTVLPPPPRKPKGKSTVENHVRYLETHLIEKLKENTYISLQSLNDDIKRIIVDINQRQYQKMKGSRTDSFEKYDKPYLKPIPGDYYSSCDYKYFSKVPDNYHLEYDGHYYSVLYTFHGKPAILKATFSQIKICDRNNRLICTHERSYKAFPRYITDDAHMKPEHLFYKDINTKDGSYYRKWAKNYGPNMLKLIDTVLRSSRHEEQSYNSCNGILHMCKDTSHVLVEEAARKCIETNTCQYSYFKKVFYSICNEHDSESLQNKKSLPKHNNIRGKDYYQ